MNRRWSGFSVVGPEPEGPRYDGRQRRFERDPRTEPPHPSPSKPRRSTKNRGPSGFSVSTAVGGFLHAKAAEGLSPRTLHNYDRYLRTWVKWASDPPIGSVTANGIRSYLAWLRTEYKPHRFGGRTEPLSGKTLRNVYMFLSSFLAWASVEFKIADPTDRVQPPRFQPKPIEPLTREEVQAMVCACELAQPAATNGRKSFQMRRRTGLRLIGRKRPDGLGRQGPPVQQEEHAVGQPGFHQPIDGGDGHARLAVPCGHGHHHAALSVADAGLDGGDGRARVLAIGVIDRMLSEPRVRGREVRGQALAQGSGCMETSNLSLRDQGRAQIGMVDQVAVGGVHEWDAGFAEAEGALGQGPAVAFCLADHFLRTDLGLLGFHVGDRTAIEVE